MNYGTIYRRVISEGGFDISAGNVPLSQVQQWVKERYEELVLEAEYLQETVALATIQAGLSIYSFDNVAIDRIRSLFVGSEKYARLSAEQMMALKAGRLGLDADTVGGFAPSYSSSGVVSVELFPGPTVTGATLSAIVNAEPPALTADTDVPVLPTPYHVALVWGPVATGLMLIDEDQQAAAAFEQKYEALKEKLKRQKNKRIGSGPVQIQVAGIHF